MLAPSGGGLILYQAYGNLYAMTGRKAHLLEDKQIPTLGWHLKEIHVTWDHLEKKRTSLRTCTKIHQEVLFSEHGDGVASIKQRHRDLSGDGAWILGTAPQRKTTVRERDTIVTSLILPLPPLYVDPS
ncbi:hypothetical protein Tco_1118226 [Tanacetum coccineum]